MVNLENISFDHCIKCTVCTIYCPVARVTHLYPGPKQSGPDAERLRIKNPELMDESLKYCNNCKRCEIACPSNVKIADIIQTAKWKYSKRETRIRDFFLSRTDLIGQSATMAAPIVNAAAGSRPVKALLDHVFGIPSRRTFPQYRFGTFASWLKKQEPAQLAFDRKVVYFHGCYVNYNDHELGKAVVKVLNAMNIGVVAVKEKCCGVPLIANGYLEKARENAAFNIANLSRAADRHNAHIVSASSTCSMTLKHEYANVLEMDVSSIARRTDYITRFILEEFENGNIPTLKPVELKAAYHSPCHLERMGGVLDTIGLLKHIPGLDLKILHSECCGIAGTYGFKSEFYQVAQDVGKELFKRIQAAEPQIVITDCETCKWQIEMSTPYKVVHPIKLLADATG